MHKVQSDAMLLLMSLKVTHLEHLLLAKIWSSKNVESREERSYRFLLPSGGDRVKNE